MMLRLAMAVLCVGAVSFLLRVLFALVLEATKVPSRTMQVHLAKFDPRKQPRKSEDRATMAILVKF